MCNNKQFSWTMGCLAAFVVTLVINYLSTTGVIGTPQKDLSDKYYLPITPPGWAFSIWGVIYLWQAVWIIYHAVISCQYSSDLQADNTLMFGLSFYVSWILSCACNMGWIVAFATEQITLSTFILLAITGTLYWNLWTTHRYLGQLDDDKKVYPSFLISSKCIQSAYRGLLLNGVAFYGTWTSIAQCLNIAITLTYEAKVDAYTASLVALSVLTATLVLYWICDFYLLRSYLIYTYSPYAVLLWALSAISTNPEEGELALKGATRTFIYVLIALSAVTAVAKIVMGVVYGVNGKNQKRASEVATLTENEEAGAQYNIMTEAL